MTGPVELEHKETSFWAGGPGGCGTECACGTTYDGFDTIAQAHKHLDRHIADATAEAARRADRARGLAEALHQVAAMVESHHDIADVMGWTLDRLLVPAQTRANVVALTRAGARSGGVVTKHQSEDWAGSDIRFGPISLHVYAGRGEVCERIVLGTHEETQEVPDPELLAQVPLVTRTVTVEDVEWRCSPLLADEEPAGGGS